MKRFVQLMSIILFPLFFAFIFFSLIGSIQPGVIIKYNGEMVFLEDSKPIYYDDEKVTSILVPADILAKKMGDNIVLNLDSKTMTIKNEKYTMRMNDNSKDIYVNNVLKTAPIPVTFKDDHVYVPLRFFYNSLGKNIYWDSSTTTVNIFDSHVQGFLNYIYASDFVSNENLKVQPNKVYFYNNNSDYKLTPEYLPEQKLNPLINTQIYNLTNAIIDPAYYTLIDYIPAKDASGRAQPYINFIAFERKNNSAEQMYFFNFKFYEKRGFNLKEKTMQKDLTTNASLMLQIKSLENEGSVTRVEDKNILKERLRLSIISIFGENVGLEISSYLEEEYNRFMLSDEKNTENYKRVRRFDKVRVDVLYNFDGEPENTLQVYFSIRP